MYPAVLSGSQPVENQQLRTYKNDQEMNLEKVRQLENVIKIMLNF